jgi:glycosyltransferase involved in cell wall biosynthesis
MKVLLATPGTDVGGAERVVIALAHALPARGHEVVLWGPSGALEPELAGAPVERIVVPYRGRSPARFAADVASLGAAVRRTRASVVHAHNPRVTALAVAAARVRGPRRPPVLATFQGGAHAEYRAAARLFRAADATTCVSEELAAGLRAAGHPADRIHVIANAVVIPPADAAAVAAVDAELGLAGAPVVAIVGRLAPQKNHLRFLEAAQRVRTLRPDVRFLVVGDGELRGQLTERARELGLDAAVTFTGMRRDVPALAARADLVVFSSDWEGLPLAGLEALAAGTPLVSTPVEGMRELREGGAAEVVAEAGADAVADGILALLADDARRAEMGERGRRLVAERYSAAAMVDAYEAQYRALTASARSS